MAALSEMASGPLSSHAKTNNTRNNRSSRGSTNNGNSNNRPKSNNHTRNNISNRNNASIRRIGGLQSIAANAVNVLSHSMPDGFTVMQNSSVQSYDRSLSIFETTKDTAILKFSDPNNHIRREVESSEIEVFLNNGKNLISEGSFSISDYGDEIRTTHVDIKNITEWVSDIQSISSTTSFAANFISEGKATLSVSTSTNGDMLIINIPTNIQNSNTQAIMLLGVAIGKQEFNIDIQKIKKIVILRN